MGNSVAARYVFAKPTTQLSAEAPVFHSSAAAYVVGIVWFLVIVVGMGRALLKN